MLFKLKVIQEDDIMLATDIGYLLGKNPFNDLIEFDTKFGIMYLTFPEKNDKLCEMNIIYDVDGLDLFKKANSGVIKKETLDHYVNNKSYVFSSLFVSSFQKIFNNAISGKFKENPDLVNYKWDIELELSTIKLERISQEIIKEMIESFGYYVEFQEIMFNEKYPEWGNSKNYNLIIKHKEITLKYLFNQMCVFILVMNPDRHIFLDKSSVEGLIHKCEDWLKGNPYQDLIISRYFGNNKQLFNLAKDKLIVINEDTEQDKILDIENQIEKKESLGEKRYFKIISLIKEHNYNSFVDLGCSNGNLIKKGLREKISDEEGRDDCYFKSIIGVDVSHKTLEYLSRKLNTNEIKNNKDDLIVNLIYSSLLYKDHRLLNQDVFVLSEIIEHIEIEKHNLVLSNIFEYYLPNIIIITTPNKEYNKVYEIPENKFRHRDHRFEWTREEFKNWCNYVENKFHKNYEIYESGFIGDIDIELGGSCQYVVFAKKERNKKIVYDSKIFNQYIENQKGIFLDKILNTKSITTSFNKQIELKKENTYETLHDISRFSIPYEQLIYVPPTMSPVESGENLTYLEHPLDVFKYFKQKGVTEVLCEVKHMGSRIITLICKDEYTSKKLFNLSEGKLGISWTRSGYNFFYGQEKIEKDIHERINKAITDSGLWEELNATWILLDSELTPWNFKGEKSLIINQYADVGCSSLNTLEQTIKTFYSNKNLPTSLNFLKEKYENKLKCIKNYIKSYENYIWNVNGIDDLRIFPFHILASNKKTYFERSHNWHLETINKIIRSDKTETINRTACIDVNLNNEIQIEEAVNWWLLRTNLGIEGMVVKPKYFLTKENENSYIQPAIKCRGKEYLRLIYGAEYDLPENIRKLRKRNVKKKRFLAMSEFLLGLEALKRFTENDTLENIHQCIFGIMSLSSEPIDCRL